jgi:hypothetical protein
VNEVYYFVAGIFLIVLGLVMSRMHPRKWLTISNLLYVAGMSLVIFGFTIVHDDPITSIPSDIWSILQYIIIVGSFYGFLYKIEWDMRHEFDDKLKTLKEDLVKQIESLKNDIHRDIDRLERMLSKK